jgi:hypothetical protein
MTEANGAVRTIVVAAATAAVIAIVTSATSEAAEAHGGVISWISSGSSALDRWLRDHLALCLLICALPLVIFATIRIRQLVKERRLPFTGDALYSSDAVSESGYVLLRWWTCALTLLLLSGAWSSPAPTITACFCVAIGVGRTLSQAKRAFAFA